jgi:hypothetical protein
VKLVQSYSNQGFNSGLKKTKLICLPFLTDLVEIQTKIREIQEKKNIQKIQTKTILFGLPNGEIREIQL